MLDLMRRHARSWLIKVALGGIIIVFVFWYGWSGPSGQPRNYAAKVNGTIITKDQFYTVYESEVAKMKLRFKWALPTQLFKKLNLKQKVLEGMVDRLLLMQEAEKLGMFVTDEDLVREIRSNPLFQRNGTFDSFLYKAFLESIKLQPAIFEDFERQRILADQLVKLLTDGVETDPGEIKRLWHFQNDRLVLSMLLVKTKEETKQPSNEALESYFKKNRAKYKLPATLNLKYVVFSWKDVAKKIRIPDDQARTYYDTHPKEFIVPARVKVSHILLKLPKKHSKEQEDAILKKAKDLLARIKGGERFETVAKTESQDEASAKKGGYLGYFSKGTMNSALEEVAFKLKPGEVSDPILAEDGYHLIRVEETTPEKQVEFALAKDKIVNKLSEQAARNQVNKLAQDFYEQVYRSEKLDEQAVKFGLPLREGKFITKNGGIPDVGTDPKVMNEAFQLKVGEISKLLKSGDKYVVMQIEDRTDARLPTLDEVRSSVEKDYMKQLALRTAEKKASEIIKDLEKKPEDPKAVAQKFGLAWKDLDPVSRTTGIVPELGNSPLVHELLTTISPDHPLFSQPLRVTGGVAVVRLSKVEPATESQYEKEAPSFEKWVVEVRKTDFLKGWVQRLREKSEVTLNDKLL